MNNLLTFVHLSDIHFRKSSGQNPFDLDDNLRHELNRDAVTLLERIGSPNGVLVSGDIAFSGKSEEYKIAGDWLELLCTQISCPKENVLVIPGNHDIDRSVIARSKLTRDAHSRLRQVSVEEINRELQEYCTDPAAANALFEPLAEYNRFAARFQCQITPEKPFWEQDIPHKSGFTLRIRGMTSVLVSNSEDAQAKMILGEAQASVRREPSVEHLILCHHPLDWFRDQDLITDHVVPKTRFQLFGHKHSQRLLTVGEGLRITAGAMHPERRESRWEPMYNIIQIGRDTDGALLTRVFPRKWNVPTSEFRMVPDPSTNAEYFEKTWRTREMTIRNNEDAPRSPRALPPQPGTSSPTMACDNPNDRIPQSHLGSPSRRLTYRFLTLPFRLQMEIAQTLCLITDEDRALPESALFLSFFARARDRGCLARLWEETQKHHGEPPEPNPFTGR